jgi:hypothetical protein
MRRETVLGKWWLSLLLAGMLAAPAAALARPPQRDFLTQTEADKIRDAESANERIKLFLDFAADRLFRFKRELQMKGAGPRWSDFLNDMLDSFSSCVDSATDRISDGISQGEDVRAGIKDVKKRVPEFLEELQKIKKQGVDLKLYEDTLNDTIDDMHEDIKSAEKAEKRIQMNPPKPKSPQGGALR